MEHVLSDEQLSSVIAEGIRKYNEEHPCKFEDDERKPLHTFARACKTHKAEEDDILIMVYSAKQFTGILKRGFVGVLVCVVLVVLWIFSGEIFRHEPSAFFKMFGH